MTRKTDTRCCALCGFNLDVAYYVVVNANLCKACAEFPLPQVRRDLEKKRQQLSPVEVGAK